MTSAIAPLQINAERLRADFDALSQIGTTGDGGVHRPAFSEAHLAAQAWFRDRIQSSGLKCCVDAAGNHSAILPSSQPHAPTLMIGSHLDSVPHGGRFDGALGVVIALEILRTVRDAQLDLPVHLEAIDFVDEEGTHVGHLGSLAFTGQLTSAALTFPRSGRSLLEAGLQRAGRSEADLLNAKRAINLAGYLELHVEQGTELESSGTPIGIVTHILGKCSYRLTFKGRADHAGTTPMAQRFDALQGACAFTLAVRETVLQEFLNCVANVGNLHCYPGAFNIVPGEVIVSLEFRAMTQSQLDGLRTALLHQAEIAAKRFSLSLTADLLYEHQAAIMHEHVQNRFRQVCERLNLSYREMVSGSGHDGQSLSDRCPVGMIFIPSVNGVGHSPHELSHWHDCVNGANVLLQTTLLMALNR